MLDVSRRGMQISLSQELWLEAQVRVEWHGRVLVGIVRHQRECDGRIYIGIELASPDESLVAEVLAQQVADLRAENEELIQAVGRA